MSSITQSPIDTPEEIVRRQSNLGIYYLLFFISGFPALLYQIVWQRALFTLYGVNIQSVTIIVTVFMLGLGVGSAAGGWLSSCPRIRLLLAFGLIEFSVGIFGFFSLSIFHRIASFTAGSSTLSTGITAFALLLVPTLLMGSTLPLLVEHIVRHTGNVGESVGSLYCVNTMGSAAACLFAAIFLMHSLGESGCVHLAVSLNIMVGISATLFQLRNSNLPVDRQINETQAASSGNIPFWIGTVLAGAIGFIALAYEIIWFRLYSFVSMSTAQCFALLLAFYLFGIACGSLVVHEVCRSKLKSDLRRTLQTSANVVIAGTIVAYLVGPALARTVVHLPYGFTYIFIAMASGLLGAAFPLLAHAAIDPTEATGTKISYLYLSNILGSTAGSFIVGFIILNYWSTQAASVALLALGFIVAGFLYLLSRPTRRISFFVCGSAICLLIALLSSSIYSGMYERLLMKRSYAPNATFRNLIENRSGVIAVDSNETVYGEGAYDGRFNTSLKNDTNGIFRAYATAGLYPRPMNMLVIGLSSGSWVQVVANNPEVKDITVVEINPGYIPLIKQYPLVSSLLKNPKVHIVIDDGRRWLVAHPDRKFDFILMNTTWNWRANTSNLLSIEFLKLARAHLNRDGIEYYNTTGSPQALLTGATIFPYALRISGFLAVSDSPILFNQEVWRRALLEYSLNGKRMFDMSNPADRSRLEDVIGLAGEPGKRHGLLESRDSILKRFQGARLITDDNMGTEWP